MTHRRSHAALRCAAIGVGEFYVEIEGGSGEIPASGTIEMFGPGEVFLMGRSFTLEFGDNESRTITALMEPERPPFAACTNTPLHSCTAARARSSPPKNWLLRCVHPAWRRTACAAPAITATTSGSIAAT
jgi:hypothetical protein